MNFPTTPEIESLRLELQKAQASQVALSEKAVAHRDRAPRLAKELAEAMADGDTARVDALRSERGAAEHDIRDLTDAQHVAGQRIAAADNKLARAEWPLISETIEAAVARFNALGDEANGLSSAIRDGVARANGRYTAAFGDDDISSRPNNKFTKRLSGVASAIFSLVRDIS